MPSSPLVRTAATLALIAGGGVLAAEWTPERMHFALLWPVGLVTGVFLLGTRRQTALLTAVLLAIVWATHLTGDYPADVAAGYALVTVLEGWLVQRVLPRRSDGSAWLLHNAEFVSYALACLVGAAVGGAGFGVVAAATGFGTAWEVGLAVAVTHLASQLIVVPFFLRITPMVLPQERRERLLRWVTTVGITVAAFLPSHVPTLVFLVLPVLAWTAVRAPLREIQLQLLTVTAIGSAATAAGLGPFDHFVKHAFVAGELYRLPHQAFIVSCVLVTMPFALAVRQQRESQREAATLRSRSDLLVNSAHGLVIIGTDDLGRINSFNPGAEQVLGYSAEEVYGESPEIFHTDDEIARVARVLGCKDDFFTVISTYLTQRPGTPMDWEFVRKDGGKRILSFALSPVIDESGEMAGFIATADDVTERVQVLQALEASLRTAVEAEKQAVRRLTEVDRAKDSFVSAVTHELRTPITSLLGYLEMLRDGTYGELNAEQRRALDRIGLNSQRLLLLVDDVLALSRLESLDLDHDQDPVDLTEVVATVGSTLQQLGDKRALLVEVQVPSHPVVVRGDREQLTRMVAQLGDNAAKFTPEGGQLSLVLDSVPGERCVLEVRDTGVGISAEDQGRIFERFFRTDAADADAVAGTGLGLYLAKAIAEAHGATITCESLTGVGTTFSVAFVGAPVESRTGTATA